MDDATNLSPGRDWPAQSLRSALEELSSFCATFAAITLSPKRFAAEWADGERPALNPLAFFFTSLAIIAPYRAVVAGYLGAQGDSSLWVNLAKPVAAVVPTALIALVFHAVLRLGGSQRPVASTIGVVLYAVGGPARIVDLYSWPVGLYSMAHPHAHSGWLALAGLGSVVIGITYFVLLARALHGLHGVKWWWTLLGILAAGAVLFPLATWIELHHPALMVGLQT